MNQVAKRLQDVREEKGFTINAIAEKTGISVEDLQAFEEGSKLPDVTALMQLSKAYEMSIDRILYTNSEMPQYDESKAVYANIKPGDTSHIDKEHAALVERHRASDKKAKVLTHMVFPVLCVVIYLFLGMTEGFWHPGWIIFLGIPLYYGLVWITSRLGKNVDSAVQEYMDEENKK